MSLRKSLFRVALLALVLSPACAADDLDIEDGPNDDLVDGKADGFSPSAEEIAGMLALVNDRAVDVEELDIDAGLSSTVAKNIINTRNGADKKAGTADDVEYETLQQLDKVRLVGPKTMGALIAYARKQGYFGAAGGTKVDVIFSPQPAGQTHTARAAQLIRGAQYSVDIAMYSFSDADVSAALAEATARGVKVRFLYEGAGDDGRAADPSTTKSGKLERAGVNVRGVNKILHHKFMIVDGPRDVADRAKTAKLVTGSANWSFGGAQTYDENTLFIENSAELAVDYQREFDLLWSHSKDFVLGTPMPYELSTARLDTPSDDPSLGAIFTTGNFTVADGSTTFKVDKMSYVVADELVAAIMSAKKSIYVAEGHLRLRPVAEAIIAARQANPDLDIRVHLDQQEFISPTGHNEQIAELNDCLAAAGDDEREIHDCLDSDFYFSKQVVDAGIPLRLKSFAYRWDATYAVQMHHKYIIIDGTDLWTGSFNLSTNSEQGTFENVVHLTGPQHKAVIDKYTANFLGMWELGRAENKLEALRQTIQTAPTIPLVFESLSLTYAEFSALRALIRQNCPAADSQEFRSNPGAHKFCQR